MPLAGSLRETLRQSGWRSNGRTTFLRSAPDAEWTQRLTLQNWRSTSAYTVAVSFHLPLVSVPLASVFRQIDRVFPDRADEWAWSVGGAYLGSTGSEPVDLATTVALGDEETTIAELLDKLDHMRSVPAMAGLYTNPDEAWSEKTLGEPVFDAARFWVMEAVGLAAGPPAQFRERDLAGVLDAYLNDVPVARRRWKLDNARELLALCQAAAADAVRQSK